MDEIVTNKVGIAALISVLVYLEGTFNDIFWIFMILMLFDYVTGFVASIVTGTRNSKIGLHGIFKKLGYVVIVVLGMLLDIVIRRVMGMLQIGIFEKIGFEISIGLLFMLFFIGNESISIVENLNKMGLKLPKWFVKLCLFIKKSPDILLKPFLEDADEKMDAVGTKRKKKSTSKSDHNEGVADKPTSETQQQGEDSNSKPVTEENNPE